MPLNDSTKELIRDFVEAKSLDLKAAFDAGPARAQQILANHVEKLILIPRESEDGPVFEVSGDIDLFGGDRTVMGLS